MAKKIKIRDINIVEKSGAFTSFFKKMAGDSDEYDYEGISALRRLLSNEKARVLHIIKSKHPDSIYSLARIIGRDFKSVFDDVKLLERFGFIELVSERTGKRERLKPVISASQITINIKF